MEELLELRIIMRLLQNSRPQLCIYKAVPVAHDAPIRCTSAMNLELEMGWQAEAAPGVAPAAGAWSSGE